MLSLRRWSLPIGLLLASCASAPPPPPPHFTEVPAAVLDAFCVRLHDEGVLPETAYDVVTMTQPLITPQAMVALAEASSYQQRFDPVTASNTANGDAVPLPVVVPRGTCAWRRVDETARRAVDVMTVELSSPIKNPFFRNAYGLFARVSLGSEAATWYWIPVAERDGRALAGRAMLLGLR